MSFENLNLIEPILKALKTEGYTTPTPIQKQAIPLVLAKKDLLGCAQTGTGKTLAFGIPVIQRLAQIKGRGLIILPTRELALQVDETLQKVKLHLKENVISEV